MLRKDGPQNISGDGYKEGNHDAVCVEEGNGCGGLGGVKEWTK